jgi:hypothetical protein
MTLADGQPSRRTLPVDDREVVIDEDRSVRPLGNDLVFRVAHAEISP